MKDEIKLDKTVKLLNDGYHQLTEDMLIEIPDEFKVVGKLTRGEEIVRTFGYDEVGFVMAHVCKSQVLPELYARIIKTVDSRFAVVAHTGVGI